MHMKTWNSFIQHRYVRMSVTGLRLANRDNFYPYEQGLKKESDG